MGTCRCRDIPETKRLARARAAVRGRGQALRLAGGSRLNGLGRAGWEGGQLEFNSDTAASVGGAFFHLVSGKFQVFANGQTRTEIDGGAALSFTNCIHFNTKTGIMQYNAILFHVQPPKIDLLVDIQQLL